MARRRMQGPRWTKKDANHDSICRQLRLFPGILVFETVDVGGGFGDCVVANILSGKILIVELKARGKEHELTKNEVVFHERWRQFVMVASSARAILDALDYPDDNIVR